METNKTKSDEELYDLDSTFLGFSFAFYRAMLGVVIVLVLFYVMFAW
jgi:hypothetical protein